MANSDSASRSGGVDKDYPYPTYWMFTFTQYGDRYRWSFATKEEAEEAWALLLLAAKSINVKFDPEEDRPIRYSFETVTGFRDWVQQERVYSSEEEDQAWETDPTLGGSLPSGTDASAAGSSEPTPTTGAGSTEDAAWDPPTGG